MKRQTSEKRNWKTRTLRIEDLEKRELLSVNPLEASAELIPQNCVILSAAELGPERAPEESIGLDLDTTMTEMLRSQGQNPNALSESFVFNLNSKPDSNHTIYLDFTGHTTTGTYWNSSSRPTITTPAYDVDGNTSSFSNQELRNIYEVWLRVSEDYMPFDVNVTTKEPSSDMLMKSSSSDQTFGVRVCIGGRATDWYISSGTATGVSYVDVFDYSSDLPTFVFSGNCSTIQHIADSVSHETGHSLSLSHDGKGSDEYYFGGDGWGPIMGGAGWQELVQWSHGEYSGATNPQEDDLAEISSRIGYRADDHGDAIANATPLTFTTGEFGAGIIERNTDVDYFSFNLNGEGAVIKVGGIKNVTNLDVKATVYNANGAVVGEYDPTDALYATIDVSNFSPGKYYLKVEGTGKSPVYSDYGSLGAYTIEATSRSIVVNTNEDVVNTADDKISLREALTIYASDGDTITFDSSLKGKTITLKSDLSQIYVTKNITIDASNLYTESTATPGVTVSGGDATRIMYLASGKAMTIKGLKFTHGKSPACGGAIWNSGALTVQDCVFADNDATFKYDDGSDGWYYGGAIAVKPGATINASRCVFSGNNGAGAVAFQTDANSTFENCQFLDNGTYGVYHASGTARVTVNGSTLSGNTYGIYLRSNDGTLVVSDSEFSSNKYYGVYLYGSGALNVSGSKISGNMYGLYVSGATGSVAVVDSEFSSNEYGVYMNGASGSVAVSESVISSNQYGAYVYKGELSLVDTFITSNTRGGIYCLQDGVVDATNVVIADNVANYYGAGVYLIGKATLRNSTIANNSAGYYGGGVYLNNSAVLNVYNSIIVGNSAQYGDKDVYKYGSDARANAWNVLSSYTSWDSGSSQFTYDENLPLFSYVSQGDYSLADSSQAINKGANEHVTTQTDIVGVARIFDETVDLGAYEYGVALSPLTPPTITTTSSTSDSITVKWNAVTNATGYVVEYKSEKDVNYTSMSSTVSTSRTITNLAPGTNYKIRVYALGDGTNNSNSTYSAVKDVKTQSVMLTTPTITTSSSTTSSITIKWNSVENASGYVVAYKKSTDSSYTVMSPTTTTSRTITNLSANTTYNVKLYAQGDGTVYTDSNYSAVKSVATQPVSDVETPSTTVTTDLDVVDPYDGKISLREALVTYSNAGDTVRFATAMKGKTITLDPDRNQLYISRNVTIDASNLYTASTGTPGVTISGGDATRIMYLASGKTMTIKGLKFTHGKSPACGGAIWDSGNLIVQDCVFADNNATFTDDDGSAGLYYGAAIAVKSGATINANRCVFSGNAGAGTISFQTDANSTIKNCQFIDNDTHGVYLAYGAARITVEDSVFTGNEYGVNLYSSSGSIVASNCTLSSNVVGAYVYAGSLSLNGDVITSNTSHGVYGASNGVVEATNVVIANNRGGWGAGIELFGEMTLRNSTVANNVATSGGGGVDLDSSAVLNVYNSIIACNTSPRGADVNKYSSSAQANAWNVISSYTAWDSGANQLTYNENQPLFADAAQGVYSLAENSQAINKGANENVTTQTDLAGNKRIIDGTVDLGAYEYGAVTPTPEPTPLDVPTWKTVSSTTNSITVTWNAVANASRYVVEYKTLRDTSYTVAPSVASTTFTILNLDADTTYYLRVYAVGDGSNYSDSPYSTVKAVKTKTTPEPTQLDAPTWKTSSSTANTVTVAWNPVANASRYVVEYKTSAETSYTVAPSTASTTFTILNLASETTYKLRVYAVGDGVNYSDSAYSTVKAVKTKTASSPAIQLDAPTWKSSSSTANSVTVTWNAVAYASGYVVEYKSENDSTFTPVQQTTATTITIPSLASETTYKFRVLAVGDGASYSDSAYSAIKAVKTKAGSTPVSQLDAPTWKSSSSTASSVTLAWNAVANASGYVVEYKDGNAATFTPLPQTDSTTLTIPNLNAETTYKFRVLAVGNGASYSDSAYSAIKAVKTKAGSNPVGQLDAPTWKSSSSTGSSVTVAWNAVANAQGYVVEYKTSTETNYTVAPKTTATTLTIPNLASETTYKLRVYAVGDGTSYSDSVYSAIKAVKTKAEEPAADPTITSVSYNSATRQATITWDAIPGAATYKLQLSKDGGATWANYKTGLTVTNATVNGLYPGNAYALRVYGVSSGGATITTTYAERPFAPIALTSASDTYRPGVAISVTQTCASNATSTIKWYNVTPNGDVEITAARNKLTYTPPTTANYDIKVVATGTGDSEGAASTLVFANYSSVRVVSYDSSTRQATLSWGAITGAATYKLQLSKDGGATWANYKTGLTTTTATVNGLYVGKTYGFRVYGITSSGTTLSVSYEKLFAPTNSSSSIVDAAFADFFEEEFFEA